MSNIFAKLAAMALAVGWLAGLVPSAAAGTVTLQSLLDGGSIQVGNQTFTHFSGFSVVTYGGSGVDASQIYVSGASNGSQVGLNFQSSQINAVANQPLGIKLNFDVVSGGPVSNLHGSALDFQATGYKGGRAGINVSLNGGATGLAVSTASGIYKSSSGITPSSNIVHVSVDMSLFGGLRPASFASIGQFTILFENPEPGSLTLLSIGVLGLLGYRWRRSHRLVRE
jgi:hypothetical protein